MQPRSGSNSITFKSLFLTHVFSAVLTVLIYKQATSQTSELYRGADKSLARPGRKQATATEDIEFHVSYL